MPKYIEFDKTISVPTASVGTAILGVNSSNQLTITNSSGSTIPIPSSSVDPYLEYSAKLTQTSTNAPSESAVTKNTLGLTNWTRTDSGVYVAHFSQVTDYDKVAPSIYPNSADNVLSTFTLNITNNVIDSSFNLGDPGLVGGPNYPVHDMGVQSDGKIIIVGEFYNYSDNNDTFIQNYVSRLNTDGTVDTSFISDGGGFDGGVGLTVKVLPDDSVLIGGGFGYFITGGLYPSVPYGIVKLNSNGSINSTFNSNGGSGFFNSVDEENGPINKITLQPDGKILCGGRFNQYNGTNTPSSLCRLTSTGLLDTTFISSSLGARSTINQPAYVNAIAIQSDGKIIVGGNFYRYNGVVVGCIARLNIDGTLDTTFNNGGSGFNSDVLAIAIQPDGKILVGGNFDTYNGLNYNYMVRLNEDGTPDNTFIYEGDGFNDYVSEIALQGDNILVGGPFTTVSLNNGYFDDTNHMIRLNKNGELINQQYPLSDFVNVYKILPVDYPKMFVAGNFLEPHNYIAKLYSSWDVQLILRSHNFIISDEALSNTPVEIRVYS
jgi:uncharacterized delta-60 repeat protein